MQLAVALSFNRHFLARHRIFSREIHHSLHPKNMFRVDEDMAASSYGGDTRDYSQSEVALERMRGEA